jgi:hypothetical protein
VHQEMEIQLSHSSKAVMGKIAEHLMLPSELKTGCQMHFRFRCYGGKTFPGWPELVEGAEIAHKFMSQLIDLTFSLPACYNLHNSSCFENWMRHYRIRRLASVLSKGAVRERIFCLDRMRH